MSLRLKFKVVIPVVFALGLGATLGGCTQTDRGGSSRLGETNALSYQCFSADQRDRTRPRYVSVLHAPDGSSLTLNFSGRQSDVLWPLSGSPGRVYAGRAYAWRDGDPVSVLTDIAAVEKFDCSRAADGRTAR
jgi:hypothetical protein